MADPSRQSLEEAAMRRFRRRMIPLLAICYFVYRLDLLNVGFAGLTMNRDLHLSPSAFGFGVGVFYWGFFLCQIPSNLMLERVGARRWLPFIMLLWSVLAGCMALVAGERSFDIMRFVLGAADAGFFPGIIFYVSRWSPAAYCGRMVSLFNIGGLFAPIIGGPIAISLLKLDGAFGISGWRWLFISEAVPAVLLAAVLAAMITDGPADATWLSPAERDALQTSLADERAARDAQRRYTMREALTNGRVILLSLAYFGILAGISATGFWLPLILQQLGLSTTDVGLVSAVPYIVATLVMLVVARHSDRTGERIWHVAGMTLVTAAGFLLAGYFLHSPVMAIAAVSLAMAGGQSAIVVFWSLPLTFLGGAMAAAAVALINAVGNLGGFFGPQLIGWLREATGTFNLAMASMAIFPLFATVIILLFGRSPGMRQALARPAAAQKT